MTVEVLNNNMEWKETEWERRRGECQGILNKLPVVVKRQAEEVGKRAPDKLHAQGNHKHKTRARFKKRARK